MELAEYEKLYRLEENYWWWVGKRRIVKSILDKSKLDSGLVLDVGCGTGANFKHPTEHKQVISLDSSNDALNFCKMRGVQNLIQGDAENLPFKDDVFDLVTACDLLEHVDDNKTMTGFYRVLKPNGSLAVTVPAFRFLWSKHDQALGHRRRYNRSQLSAIIEANGFTIQKISYWNFFLFIPIGARRLSNRIVNRQKVESDVKKLPSIINGFLSAILRIESYIITNLNLPFGISLVCIAKVKK